MAITQAMATSFKVDILDGTFDFSSGTAQVFKLALYTSVSYIRCNHCGVQRATNEVSGTGYSAGGGTLTISSKSQLRAAQQRFWTLPILTFSTATITARGALDLLGRTAALTLLLQFWTSVRTRPLLRATLLLSSQRLTRATLLSVSLRS
jgi:hypothetical protein